MPLQCGLSVDYWPLALRPLFNVTAVTHTQNSLQFKLQTFPGFANQTISPPCLAGEEMVKSTYITLRISLPLLQTLPTVVFSEGLEVKVKGREFDKKNRINSILGITPIFFTLYVPSRLI
jgi:hypothetical protein